MDGVIRVTNVGSQRVMAFSMGFVAFNAFNEFMEVPLEAYKVGLTQPGGVPVLDWNIRGWLSIGVLGLAFYLWVEAEWEQVDPFEDVGKGALLPAC